MSIKTILTTIALVAGSSTAALARPVNVGHGPVVVRDHRQVQVRVQPRMQYQARNWHRPRTERRYWAQPTYVQPTYVEPSYVEPTYVQPTYVQPAVSTQGSQYISLGGAIGNGVEVELVQGEDQAFVDQVIIHYADGRDVPMHLDRTLSGYDREMQLQTESCPINGVTVIGSGAVFAHTI